MDSYLQLLWLIPRGFFAGGYGTLIGAGGGFVLAPALLLVYPSEAPETITSISLAVVFCNALSGTLCAVQTNRFQLGAIFAVATMPGAVLGALTTNAISRDKVDPGLWFSVDRGGGFFGAESGSERNCAGCAGRCRFPTR